MNEKNVELVACSHKRWLYHPLLLVLMLLCLSGPVMADGKNHALVIGVSGYKDPAIQEAVTAKADALRMAEIFRRNLNFSVTALTGSRATKKNIVNALQTISASAGAGDRILIYFAGVGEVEPLYGYGGWLGSDARKGDVLTYVENTAIRKILRKSKARQVLVISDAAFPESGYGEAVAVGIPQDAAGYTALSGSVSYTVMTSGFLAPKASGSGKNGVFTQLLTGYLSRADGAVTGKEMFISIAPQLESAGAKPVYRNLKVGKAVSGDVVLGFAKKRKDPEPVAKAAAVALPEPSPAVLLLRSNVKGAKARLNGKDRGALPLRLQGLTAGVYQVEVFAPGYTTVRQEVRLLAGDEKTLQLKPVPVPPEKGRCTITVSPAAAVITFANKVAYKPGMALSEGTYAVRVSSLLYEEQSIRVSIRGGEHVKVPVTLKPVPFYDNAMGMHFVKIDAGKFSMGSPEGEVRRDPDELLHDVTLTRSFFMQTKEVTVRDWKIFVENTGYRTEAELRDGVYGLEDGFRWVQDPDYTWKTPGYQVKDDDPVSGVSYHDAVAFTSWLSKQEGLTYALPTEAEWEYVCRAGNQSAYSYGSCLTDEQANFAANSLRPGCQEGHYRKRPIPVGSLIPNDWGVFDMHGNMWEWCQDWYGAYLVAENVDPTGPATGKKKSVRGGGWETDIDSCRTANRFAVNPHDSYGNIGFRLIIRP